MSFEPWMLALMDDGGYNGIRDEHIEKLACKLLEMKSGEMEETVTDPIVIDGQTFRIACRECGMDPDNFTEEDLRRLQQRLNK